MTLANCESAIFFLNLLFGFKFQIDDLDIFLDFINKSI